MYYVIELYEKSDLIVRDIDKNHFIDIITEFIGDDNKKAYFNNDMVAIKHGKMLTVYYKDKEKRNKTVEEILNKGYMRAVDYLSKKWFS